MEVRRTAGGTMIVDFLSPTDNHAVSRFPDINTYPLACLFSVGKGTSYISARHTEIFPRNEANEKIRMEFKNDEGVLIAVGTGTYLCG